MILAYQFHQSFASGRSLSGGRIGPRVASLFAGSRGPFQCISGRTFPRRLGRCSPLVVGWGTFVQSGASAHTTSGLFHSVDDALSCQANARPSQCRLSDVRRCHAVKHERGGAGWR
jgi:hypothetical protein